MNREVKELLDEYIGLLNDAIYKLDKMNEAKAFKFERDLLNEKYDELEERGLI